MGLYLLNIRVDDKTRAKLKVLRELGYLPSAIMRQAIQKAVDEKLRLARERGELRDNKQE